MEPPILVIGFNRPDKLRRCLEAVSDAGCKSVYVALDGPRAGNERDLFLTRECEIVIQDFKKILNIAGQRINEKNLGCKNGVKTAIDWFFTLNDFGIIVEDDILITKAFLDFCEIAESKYRDVESIFHINGWTPFQKNEIVKFPFITRYAIPWGWATWANKWKLYRENLELFNSPEKLSTNLICSSSSEFNTFWSRNFKYLVEGSIDTWDYQWIYTIWLEGGFAISPPFRLTRNIGFDLEATHTFYNSKRNYLAARNELPELTEMHYDDLLDGYFSVLHFGYCGTNHYGKFMSRLAINSTKKTAFLAFLKSLLYHGLIQDYLTLIGFKITVKNLIIKIQRLPSRLFGSGIR